jgi:pimeloyl-ACP methyl ester carboxylesterase
MHWWKPLSAAALVVLFLSSCSIGSGKTTLPPTSNSTFSKQTCPSEITTLANARQITCGFVTVPADHRTANGKTIKIAIAIYQKGAKPDTDPVFFLQGGPGGPSIKDFAPAFASGQFSFGNHDVIFVDQRGTGLSQPLLQCSELVDLQYHFDTNLTIQQQVANQDKALNTCYARLTGEGINLSDYTTYNDAGDIHDIIHALNLQGANIYGVSYGTRLAQEIMRSFPQGITSVVLDSTVPPDFKQLTKIPYDTVRVLDTLFQGCASDATCNARYPNLKTVFYGVVDQLNKTPITFQTTDQGDSQTNPNFNKNFTIVLNGDDFINVVFSAFYLSEAIPALPKLIFEVQQGNYDDLLSKFYGIFEYQDGISWGMYFSVECAEDVNFTSAQEIDTASQQYPADIRADQDFSLKAEIPECQRWNVNKVPDSQRQPITSSIPTIVLEGQYDPITPPVNGDHVVQGLSHAQKYLFPATGHGSFFNSNSTCPSGIVQQFFATPNQFPDGSCTGTMSGPQFQ